MGTLCRELQLKYGSSVTSESPAVPIVDNGAESVPLQASSAIVQAAPRGELTPSIGVLLSCTSNNATSAIGSYRESGARGLIPAWSVQQRSSAVWSSIPRAQASRRALLPRTLVRSRLSDPAALILIAWAVCQSKLFRCQTHWYTCASQQARC